MADRRTDMLDAAIARIGERGMRGLTHRAVDAAAGLPAGSTSNYFRTKDALLVAVVERFIVRERANWEELAATSWPSTAADLATTLARFTRDSTGEQRSLTLWRTWSAPSGWRWSTCCGRFPRRSGRPRRCPARSHRRRSSPPPTGRPASAGR